MSLTRAAGLLAGIRSVADSPPLLQFLGFEDTPLALGVAAVRDIALHASVASWHVVEGDGALRALIVECGTDLSTRDIVQHTATRLASAVPHLLWLIIAINASTEEIALACWEGGRRGPRVVALLADGKRVLESDAEALCALAAARASSDVLTHARWVELLGREAITRRFFRSLCGVVDELAASLSWSPSLDHRRELSILYVSRLLFLSFLEAKGWMAGDFDFLANSFARCMVAGGRFHERVLRPLFFGTLNTRFADRAKLAREFGRIPFLNGGLFTRSPLEKRLRAEVFPDEALGAVFERLLTGFRFTAREESAAWSETAIDPEILGKAFESLMASAERKSTGAFYTPQRLVSHVTESALVAALAPAIDPEVLRALLSTGELPKPELREQLLLSLRDLRLLDPACGSGAFLVHALERIAELRLRLGETAPLAAIRRATLTSSIFGVDVNPMAVWLCQLRLWLSIVIDSTDPDPMDVVPLPNLDRQIRAGDSLLGGSFTSAPHTGKGRKLAALRSRYVRSTGPRKQCLARQMDREERREAIEALVRARNRAHADRREILLGLRSGDLFGDRAPPAVATIERLRTLRAEQRAADKRILRLRDGSALPFSFDVHFADLAADGGFSVVVGNPPWVRIHNITPPTRRNLQREFRTFRNAGWREGAAAAGSGRAFASQVDLAALFVERSVSLLRDNGAMSLLLPAKLWRSLSGGGVRALILDKLQIVALEDLTESRSGFDAAVYPSLLVARKSAGGSARDVPFAAAVFRRGSALQWQEGAARLSLDASAGSPWLVLPREVREGFEHLRAAGSPLGESPFGRPLLGVKTGCNPAYVVHLVKESHGTATISAGERTGEIESGALRPVLRGETITAWRFVPNGERIVWTHSAEGESLRRVPPRSLAWLANWRPALERRADGRGNARWWSLFRTDGANASLPRVVWADFGRTPRALVLDTGDECVPLNTCYVLRCPAYEDSVALAALLNSPPVSAWLNVIAEPARGGYRRYMGWTVSLLPIPRNWARARSELADIGSAAMGGSVPSAHDLTAAALKAYGLRSSRVEALLSWDCRS